MAASAALQPLAEVWTAGLQELAGLLLTGSDSQMQADQLAATFEEECRQDPGRLSTIAAATTDLVTKLSAEDAAFGQAAAEAVARIAVAIGVGTKNRKVQPESLIKALSSVPVHAKAAITSPDCISSLFRIVVPSADSALYDALCQLSGGNPSGTVPADFVRALEAAHHTNPQTNGRRAKVAAHMMRSQPSLSYEVDVERFLLDLLARSRWNLIDIVITAAVKAGAAGGDGSNSAKQGTAANSADLAALVLRNIEQQVEAHSLERSDEKHALKRIRSWGMRIGDFPLLKLAANKGAIKFAAWMRNPDVLQAYMDSLRQQDRELSIAYLLSKYPLLEQATPPLLGTAPPTEPTAASAAGSSALQTPPKPVRSAAAGGDVEPPFTPLMDTPSAEHAAAADSPAVTPPPSPLLTPSTSQLRAMRRKVPSKVAKTCPSSSVPGRIAALASVFADAAAMGSPGSIAEIEEPPVAVSHRQVHWASKVFSVEEAQSAAARGSTAVVAGAQVGFRCQNREQADSLAAQCSVASAHGFLACVPGPDGNLSLPSVVPVYWVDKPEHLAALASTVPADAPIAFDGEWVMQIGLQLYDGGVDPDVGEAYSGASLLQYAWPGGVALLDWVALDRGTHAMSEHDIEVASENMTHLFGPAHIAVATFAGSGDNQMLCKSPLGGVFAHAAAQTNWADASPECKQEWKAVDKKAKRVFEQIARLEGFDPAAAAAAREGILDPLTQACPMSLSACAFWQAGGAMCKYWQMSNWLRRPLTPGQVHYGALDAYATLAVHLGLQACQQAQRQLSEALQRMQAASEGWAGGGGWRGVGWAADRG